MKAFVMISVAFALVACKGQDNKPATSCFDCDGVIGPQSVHAANLYYERSGWFGPVGGKTGISIAVAIDVGAQAFTL